MKITTYLATCLSLCLTLFMVTSCKKNNKFDNYSLLTNDSWKVKDVKDDAGNSIIKECQKDDIIQFEKKAFSFIDGANKCSEGMFQKSAEWTFKDGGNSIKIKKVMKTNKGVSGAALVLRYDIVTLNDTELTLKSDDDNNVYYFER
ncbi:MAG TPA: hypothetical protein VKY37_13300 [Brumimicrobium sp.]|nr:hypothetical protein [Brumimicrobium sp.]